jgi:hypothetical protein
LILLVRVILACWNIAAAESAKSAQDLAVKRVSMENAAVEGGMGFSSPDHGLSLPSTDGRNTDVFDEAAQVSSSWPTNIKHSLK